MSRVLIIEDEAILQDAYKLVLTRQGYEVSVASNGKEGLAVLAQAPPDLILLDIFMPVMDGKEFLRNFNKVSYPTTKVVVCSNLSDSKTEAEMLKMGADSFILKSSMAPKELTRFVERTLKDS